MGLCAAKEDQIPTFVQEPTDIERGRLLEACVVCPVYALIAFDEPGRRLVP